MISDSWIMLYLIDLSRFPSRKMNSLCWISLYRKTNLKKAEASQPAVSATRIDRMP